MNHHLSVHRPVLLLLSLGFLSTLTIGLVSCNRNTTSTQYTTNAGRNSLIISDHILIVSKQQLPNRSAALIGVFVARYLSEAVLVPVRSAWVGIQAQQAIAAPETTVSDPDFQLLQAFADALQVDVADLLNKSVDRQKTLDGYLSTLGNVASRANDRFNVLSPAVKRLDDEKRAIAKQQNDIERAMQKDLDAKNFAKASDEQTQLTDLEKQLSEKTSLYDQTQRIVNVLSRLLSLYGQRLAAIQQNREPLILGTRVIDVPGATDADLNILQQKPGASSAGNGANASAGAYNGLFDLSWTLNGL